jgi:hypothetical protein
MNILRYTLLFLLIISALAARGQSNALNDTIKPPRPAPYIRAGVDLVYPARYLYEGDIQQIEFFLDSEIRHNWFVNLEGGFMKVPAVTDFNYSASGYFFRMGPDLNLLKRQHKTKHDVVLVGMRYAFSSLQHQSTGFLINNPYWGDYAGSMESNNFQLHWLEFAGGVKTEVFRNLFLSWSMRTRVRLYQTREPILNPYFIGGYGKGTRRAPVAVNFGISYRLPF